MDMIVKSMVGVDESFARCCNLFHNWPHLKGYDYCILDIFDRFRLSWWCNLFSILGCIFSNRACKILFEQISKATGRYRGIHNLCNMIPFVIYSILANFWIIFPSFWYLQFSMSRSIKYEPNNNSTAVTLTNFFLILYPTKVACLKK